MIELKKFRVRGKTVTQYFDNGKQQTYLGAVVKTTVEFKVTVYRENIANASFTLFEQYYRIHRFGQELMITELDLESLQIVEVK